MQIVQDDRHQLPEQASVSAASSLLRMTTQAWQLPDGSMRAWVGLE